MTTEVQDTAAALQRCPIDSWRPRRSIAWSLPEVRWAVAATALFGMGSLAQLAGGPVWLYWALYLACYAAGGWKPGLAGLKALLDKTLDVDLLMVVAAVGAAAIGQVFDGALRACHSICVSPGWSKIGPPLGRTEGVICDQGHSVVGFGKVGGSAIGGDVFG